MRQRYWSFFSLLGCLFATLSQAFAHPSSANMAITAPTVAEIHVTHREVRLTVEIGATNKAVFLDALSDGPKNEPTVNQRRFMDRGWVIEADDEILRGQVVTVEQRRRLRRDPITGEVLPPLGPPLDLVTFLEIRYPLKKRPDNIHFKPPKAADGATAIIGMVVHHQGIPVCDFDFFKLPVGFRLDWDDPWKSRFRGLRFQRYYNAPLWGTLSVEPRDVRIEFVVRPVLANRWVNISSVNSLPPVASLPDLGAQVRNYLANKIQLSVNQSLVKLQAEPVAYLQQKLAKIEAVTNLAGVPAEAIYFQFALTFQVPTRPNEVRVDFGQLQNLFSEFQLWVNAGTNPPKITPLQSAFTWKDQSTLQDTLFTDPMATEPRIRLPLLSVGIGLLGFLWIVPGFAPFRTPFSRLTSFIVVIILAALSWPMLRVPVLQQPAPIPLPETEQARRMVHRMLADAYRAFDCRDEEAVYDTLAESVSGPLLREAYLSIRKMLDAPNQAGRARVKEVVIKSADMQVLSTGTGYSARCIWVMEVAISHWGHTHTRLTEYDGELTIRPHEGRWKIDSLTINDEKLADPKSLTTMSGNN